MRAEGQVCVCLLLGSVFKVRMGAGCSHSGEGRYVLNVIDGLMPGETLTFLCCAVEKRPDRMVCLSKLVKCRPPRRM